VNEFEAFAVGKVFFDQRAGAAHKLVFLHGLTPQGFFERGGSHHEAGDTGWLMPGILFLDSINSSKA